MNQRYLAIVIGFITVLTLFGCSNSSNPIRVLDEFDKSWEKQDYSDMYNKLSIVDKDLVSQEDFKKSYQDFYKALGVKNITIENLANKEDLKDQIKSGERVTIPISVKLKTAYGDKSYQIDAFLVKDEVEGKRLWKVDWDYNMIYKEMAEGDTIKTRSITPIRGEIIERNGLKIAQNGSVVQVGIVPGRLGDMKGEMIRDLAETFHISEKYIQDRLKLTWVTDDTFVDIIKIPKEKVSLIKKLNAKNKGATYKEVNGRVYPYKEIAAHLTGYLGYMNENELKKLEPLGFTSNDKVGRTGLEKIFDESLRGIPGNKVVIVSDEGNDKEILMEEAVKNGEDLNVTIDIEMQKKLFSQIENEKGTAASMDYTTGEVLALVSSPSYDPNKFILGISTEDLKELQQSKKTPLLNRFIKVYSPGSTLKPITEAIALNQGKVGEDFTIDVKGLNWKKDSSWGSYSITRVKDPGTPVDLEKAMIYSDNIYFGQVALKIGAETFVEKAKDFGIGVELKLRYGLDKSQLTSNEKITSEVLLADTGYGQGQVLVNILNLPKAYQLL